MKVGILLPSAVDLGLLRRATQLSLLLGGIKAADDSPWSVAIGVPHESEREWRAIERDLRRANPQAIVRHLKWEQVPVENARRMFASLSPELGLDGIEDVVVPRDWGWNFQDCDALIVFTDPALGAVLSLKPTLFYCSDLAVRIVPEVAARSIDDEYWERQTEAFRIWRQSKVVTADPNTIEDIVSYAGVRRERVSLFPNLLDYEVEPSAGARGGSTLAWMIGSIPLYDLENAAKGLQTYLAEGGGLEPVAVYDSIRMGRSDPSAIYSEGLPTAVADLVYGLPNVSVASERELFRLLDRSSALWSSRLAGGEGEEPLLSAQAGIGFVGADYEANRAVLKDSVIPAKLYPLNDPLAMADALHAIEEASGTAPRRPAKASQAAEKRAIIRSIIEDLFEASSGG